VELPTYTNIWKIEKRLYKLYDFRLPMPLPVGQLAVFVAIAVPYMLILTVAGMPFSHTWVWLYVLPPGVLAWLVTRPVLESKRLPELVLSQLRYLSEPRTWCRMTPLAEKDEIAVVARVWHRTGTATPSVPAWRAAGATNSAPAVAEAATVDRQISGAQPVAVRSVGDEAFDQEAFDAEAFGTEAFDTEGFDAEADAAATVAADAVDAAAAAAAAAAGNSIDVPGRPVWPSSPAIHAPAVSGAPATVGAPDENAPGSTPPAAVGMPDNAPAVVSAPVVSAPDAIGLAASTPGVAELATSGEAAIRVAVSASGPHVAGRRAAELPPAQRLAPERPVSERPVSERPVSERPVSERPVSERPVSERPVSGAPAARRVPPEQQAPEQLAPELPAAERPAAERAAADRSAPEPPWRPTAKSGLTVRTDGHTSEPLHLVERALRSSPGGGAANGWHDRVVVVPGGHRPGKPDQVQRDQARARLPLAGPARIVVLGCTAGAGQTVTTLLTGHLLAGLRGEAVAVLDLSAGPGSLTEQARQIPRLLPGRRSEEPRSSRERGLQVVTADDHADEPADAGTLIDAVVSRYPLTLADPAAAQVPRALHVADQLVLVAPASPDAAGALAMTLEWLDGHGHAELARRAIAVLNGVSASSGPHTDKAAAVATGWCRAVVRVPWDGGLSGRGPLGVGTIQAYTALAGVLVSGLAGAAASWAAQSGSAGQSGSTGQ
jgi:TcpE family